MYLAGVSVRRVEDITEALWGTRVSPSAVSDLNKKIYGTIETWRNRPIEGEHPYVYLDGIVLKRSWAGEVRNVSLLVAIGVNGEGYREILGICEGAKEDKAGWSQASQGRPEHSQHIAGFDLVDRHFADDGISVVYKRLPPLVTVNLASQALEPIGHIGFGYLLEGRRGMPLRCRRDGRLRARVFDRINPVIHQRACSAGFLPLL
jgi:hypothetical protein